MSLYQTVADIVTERNKLRAENFARAVGQLLNDMDSTALIERQAKEIAILKAESAAWKWGYEYLQDRMRSIDRHGWAADCDDEIEYRIKQGYNK